MVRFVAPWMSGGGGVHLGSSNSVHPSLFSAMRVLPLLLAVVLCSCLPVRKYSFVEPESQSSRVMVYQDEGLTCTMTVRPEVRGRMTVSTEMNATFPQQFRVEDCVVQVRCAPGNQPLPRISNYELFSWQIAPGVSDTTLKHGYMELPQASIFRDPRYTIVQQFQRGDCQQLLVVLNLRLRNLPADTTLTIAETRTFALTSTVKIESFFGH